MKCRKCNWLNARNAHISKLALLLALGVAFCGCGKERPCYDSALSIMFIHYDSTEIDTFKVVKFAKGASQGSSVDTTVIARFGGLYQHKNDTILVYSAAGKILTSGFDWKILVGQQENHKVTDIVNENKTYKCGGLFSLDCFSCFNHVLRYTYDGQSFTVVEGKEYVVIRK